MFGQKNKINWYDISSILILFIIAVTLTNSPFLINPELDSIYHANIAQNFANQYGILTWNFWESLPEGKPNIYPPLLHIFFAIFPKLGFSPLELLKIIEILSPILILALSWIGIRLTFNARTACLFLPLATFEILYILQFKSIIPASIVIALSPLLFYLIKSKRILGSTLLLTLMFYTHRFMPFFTIGALFTWASWNKTYFKTILKTATASFILFLPWIIFFLLNLKYLKYTDPNYINNHIYQRPAIINLTALILFIIALIYLLRFWQKKHDQSLLFLLVFFSIQLPIIFYQWPNRFFLSGGFFVQLVVIAFFFDRLLLRIKNKKISLVIISLVILFININTYYLKIDFNKKEPLSISSHSGYLIQSLNSIFYQKNIHQEINNQTQNMEKIGEYISTHTKENDVILNTSPINISYQITTKLEGENMQNTAAVYGLLANRSIVNKRLPEYDWNQKSIPLEDTAILIANYQQLKSSPVLNERVKNSFKAFAWQGEMIFFENINTSTFQSEPKKPILPLWLAWIIMTGFITIIIQEIIKTKKYETK